MYEYQDEDDDQDIEFDETVGLNEEDMRVTHRAAFMTLIPAWDGRLTARKTGLRRSSIWLSSDLKWNLRFSSIGSQWQRWR